MISIARGAYSFKNVQSPSEEGRCGRHHVSTTGFGRSITAGVRSNADVSPTLNSGTENEPISDVTISGCR